ncbi:hypothetical protein BDN72DRAFT_205657 [Pluteus cervinus]|uniref:Uncharacterized protein n=1 Tax=Pluteus cervinus TaxID=181527 RepID=A0ACD3AI36_9AGAR|nr:hypothetical protein BDN72DRAFT_205657 [Pluteus cervinus]
MVYMRGFPHRTWLYAPSLWLRRDYMRVWTAYMQPETSTRSSTTCLSTKIGLEEQDELEYHGNGEREEEEMVDFGLRGPIGNTNSAIHVPSNNGGGIRVPSPASGGSTGRSNNPYNPFLAASESDYMMVDGVGSEGSGGSGHGGVMVVDAEMGMGPDEEGIETVGGKRKR